MYNHKGEFTTEFVSKIEVHVNEVYRRDNSMNDNVILRLHDFEEKTVKGVGDLCDEVFSDMKQGILPDKESLSEEAYKFFEPLTDKYKLFENGIPKIERISALNIMLRFILVQESNKRLTEVSAKCKDARYLVFMVGICNFGSSAISLTIFLKYR